VIFFMPRHPSGPVRLALRGLPGGEPFHAL
jgi:hypothetical protein